MTRSLLQDPMAVSHLLVLTDLHVLAPTTSPQVLMDLLLYMVLLLMDLRYQPMGTQVCLYLDQWEESLDLGPLTVTQCTRGRALDTSLTLGVPRRHISVPLRLTPTDRWPHHTGSVDLWAHVHPSLLTCASQDHVTTSGRHR